MGEPGGFRRESPRWLFLEVIEETGDSLLTLPPHPGRSGRDSLLTLPALPALPSLPAHPTLPTAPALPSLLIHQGTGGGGDSLPAHPDFPAQLGLPASGSAIYRNASWGKRKKLPGSPISPGCSIPPQPSPTPTFTDIPSPLTHPG